MEEGRRAFGGGSPNPTEVAVKPSSSQVAAPDANSTPSDAPPPILSHDQAPAAFNFLQDRLQKPHAQSVSYDPQTDSYVWIGPKSGRRMSMQRSQFEAEIWPDYEGSALLLKVIQAIDERDWNLVTTNTTDGVTDYFGHHGASNDFIRRDIEGDAKMYRWSKSYPNPSTFRRTVTSGTVYASIEERTESLGQ